MIWRILLGVALGYLGYRVYRKVKDSLTLGEQGPKPQRIDEPETLVQDPVCQTFIPRKEALKAERDGKEYFFCSEGCLKRFRRSGGN